MHSLQTPSMLAWVPPSSICLLPLIPCYSWGFIFCRKKSPLITLLKAEFTQRGDFPSLKKRGQGRFWTAKDCFCISLQGDRANVTNGVFPCQAALSLF